MDPYHTFLFELRRALNHLYAPEILRYSPLRELLRSSDRPQAPLGEFLADAIEALKPSPMEAADSQAWHVYELLHYRYVQRASQSDLARQFACSIRQVRREQAHALAVLGEALARQAGFAHGAWPLWPEPRAGLASTGIDDPLRDEYEVTLAGGQGQWAEIGAELLAIADIVQPLLARYKIVLHLPPADNSWLISMPSVFVRQTLISLLTHLAPVSAGGTIQVVLNQTAQRVCVQLQIAKAAVGQLHAAAPAPRGLPLPDGLDEARFLLEMNGGELSIAPKSHDLLEALVTLPAVQKETVLAIDDNKDILQLFTRYTEGTQFALLPCSDPASVLRLANERNPRIITLDIMMVGVDGWQLLRDLRENHATAATPIIVCSVLAQNELVEMLGADDFVCKPVSREAYLAALERQAQRRVSPPASAPQSRPAAPHS